MSNPTSFQSFFKQKESNPFDPTRDLGLNAWIRSQTASTKNTEIKPACVAAAILSKSAIPPLDIPLQSKDVEHSAIVDSNRHIERLESLLKCLKDPKKTLPDCEVAFTKLGHSDIEVYTSLSLYVYEAFKHTLQTGDQFGENLIKKNPLILLQIKNRDNINLIQQLINQYQNKVIVQRKINELNSFKNTLQDPKSQNNVKKELGRLDATFLLNPMCRRIWELDNVHNDPHFGIPDYGYKKIIANPWLLLNYKGQDLIEDQKKALQQQAHSPISCDCLPPSLPLQLDTIQVVRNFERHFELQRFLRSLEDNNIGNEQLKHIFFSLDSKLQDTLCYYVWTASFCPNEYNFGKKLIENDVRILLRIKHSADSRNIIEQLSEHFACKALAERTLLQLGAFSYAVNRQIDLVQKQQMFKNLDKNLQDKLSFIIWKRAGSDLFAEPDYGYRVILNDPGVLFIKDARGSPPIDELQSALKKKSHYQLSEAKKITQADFAVPYHPCNHISIERLNNSIQPSEIPDKTKVTIVSAECEYLAKIGGLAAAVYGMAEALTKTDQKVKLILPKYERLPEAVKARLVEKKYYKENGVVRPLELNDCFGQGKIDRVFKLKIKNNEEFKQIFKGFDGKSENITFYFIEDTQRNPGDFDHFKGSIYPSKDFDAKERFAYFSCAAAELASKLNTHVIHAHDWHTAAVPMLINKKGKSIPTVFTLHNNEGQGIYSENTYGILEKMRLERRTTNMVVESLYAANEITTVSKNFALELQGAIGGKGLDYEMRKAAHLGQKLTGITNGSNPSIHDPRKDVALQFWRDLRDPTLQTIIDLRFSPDDPDILEKKARIAEQLQLYFAIYHPSIALDFRKNFILFVGRPDKKQKGLEMLEHALNTAIENGWLFITMVPESDDPQDPAKPILDRLEKRAREIRAGALIIRDRRRRSDNRLEWQEGPDPTKPISHEDRFSPPGIGSLLRTAAITIVPSIYEPCGLVQMEAKTKGSFPLCRATGGLAETVITEGEEMDGFLYEAKLDPCSNEQIVEFKQKLQGAMKFVDNLQQNPDAYRARLSKLINHGLKSSWTETFKAGELPPIEQMRYVYASAMKKAPHRSELFLDAHLLKK
ncbi:MAG TPA: glycogen/starch synthase [Rhabdochlamydiaceae bacterium]|nr:glycogen/starch synthase [Rhabdochlamydiaceae bacterium]